MRIRPLLYHTYWHSGKKYSERFVDMVERKRFTVFGAPSDELKGILDEFGATYHTPFDGFSLAIKRDEA